MRGGWQDLTNPVALQRTDTFINISPPASSYPGVNINLYVDMVAAWLWGHGRQPHSRRPACTPHHSFSAHWFGNFIPAVSGVFFFRYRSDDGVRFFFQGLRQPEVNGQWGNHVRCFGPAPCSS
jgi:hypothetical protein